MDKVAGAAWRPLGTAWSVGLSLGSVAVSFLALSIAIEAFSWSRGPGPGAEAAAVFIAAFHGVAVAMAVAALRAVDVRAGWRMLGLTALAFSLLMAGCVAFAGLSMLSRYR